MLRAVVFDLDGTLTRPFLDFAQIRREVGVCEDRQSLLDQIQSMPEAERSRALSILERHEREAAQSAQANEGAAELFEYVRRRGLLTAVVTRNSEASTVYVLDKLGLHPDRVLTRDSGLPLKPDPGPLLALARQWGIDPGQMLMVGDFRYDVECGLKAGAVTCLVTNGRMVGETGLPDYLVSCPGEVIDLLEKILGAQDRPGRTAAGEGT